MSNSNEVTLSLDEYLELQENSAFLECLQACGVDNWEGYDYAVDEFQKTHGSEE